MARTIETALTREINARFFWTDSSTVRNWVRATATFYQTFVSHRIGEIQTLTEAREWRFVPGKLNPADAATRSQLEAEAVPYIWLDGPTFLGESDHLWPTDLPWKPVTEEIRPVRVHHVSTIVPAFDWEKVQIGPDDIPAITQFKGEWLDLLRRAQHEAFKDDLESLLKKKR